MLDYLDPDSILYSVSRWPAEGDDELPTPTKLLRQPPQPPQALPPQALPPQHAPPQKRQRRRDDDAVVIELSMRQLLLALVALAVLAWALAVHAKLERLTRMVEALAR